jgi:hypothetical protein
MTMKKETSQDADRCPFPDKDGKKDLLARLLEADARNHPVLESLWFASRTVALARSIPQEQDGLIPSISSFFLTGKRLRWLLPLPLAGFVAVALFCSQHGLLHSTAPAFSSTESDFEQHIEMIASSDYSEDYFTGTSQ